MRLIKLLGLAAMAAMAFTAFASAAWAPEEQVLTGLSYKWHWR